MTALSIRQARSGDAVWAAALMASSDPWITLGRGFEACHQACTWAGDVLEIAELEGERCGFVLVRPSGVAGAPYVKSIAVAPGFRSRGVGAALLGHVERTYAGRARHLFLCVSSFNDRARLFYERQGYAAVGAIKDFLIEGADEILMQKRLPAPDAAA
ncbi:MAG TPA: N-acetyltransferase [Vicinamibacterales bacterium]|nr:N-acetyltransferase [Vicinamibacterales bacterium]HOG29829.1 N-acetyltransferase [Vicinamibacterales bacterium]HOQ60702.1 N-acetyltransferase [Vicinamibacterales bacterium]HPK70935.1 N-acetyltransferase [Vicinamibacterales bacterium]HPW20831.1 N-acetyltransferase [Vicinamibacterales bacterium]